MSKWHVNTGNQWFSVWDSDLEEFIMFDSQSVERVRAMAPGTEREDAVGWIWRRVS